LIQITGVSIDLDAEVQRTARVLLVGGVVGLDFDGWG